MGNLICFDSAENGVGKTTLICALVTNFIKRFSNKRILVICANLSKGNLMSLLEVKEDRIELGRLVNFWQGWGSAKIATRRRAQHINVSFIDTKHTGIKFLENNIESYVAVIDDLLEQFDYIFADLPARQGNLLSKELIKKCYLNLFISKDSTVNSVDREIGGALKVEDEKIFSIVELKEKNSIERVNKEIVIPFCKKLEDMSGRNKTNHYFIHQTSYNYEVFELLKAIENILGLNSSDNESIAVKSRNKQVDNQSRAAMVQSFLTKRTFGDIK